MSDIPLRIYKYRNFQNPQHLRIIFNGEIFFARPRDLNDPFDCRIPVRLWDGTEEQLRTFFREIGSRHMLHISDPIERAKAIKEQIEKRIKDKPKTDEEQRQDEFRLASETVSNYGVFCASLRPFISPIWAHYAANHTGFCVGINMQELINFIEARRTYNDFSIPVFAPHKVNYVDTLPVITPHKDGGITDDEYALTLHTKHSGWFYEEEVRLVSVDRDLDNGKRLLLLPPGIIDEVYFGMNIDKYDRMRISDFINERKLPIRQYQVSMRHGTFELIASPIN